jgi:hypothetical protein
MDKTLGDLKQLLDLLANSTYQGQRLLLFGFFDNFGGTNLNLTIFEERAQAVADQLKKQGITPALVPGYEGVARKTGESRAGCANSLQSLDVHFISARLCDKASRMAGGVSHRIWPSNLADHSWP